MWRGLSNSAPDVKPFANTHAKRGTSFIVLLMWLLALAAGVANACLLEARGTHGRDATAGTSRASIALATAAVHVGAVADHNDPDTSKAPCLKVCDDVSQTLIKPQPSTFDLTHPGPPLLVRVVSTGAVREVAMSRRGDSLLQSSPELPIRLRHLRLAL